MTLLPLGALELLTQSLSSCQWWFSMTLQVRYNMNSLSHLRCNSKLLISRALNTSSAIPLQHPASLFRITSQIPNLYVDCILFMGSLEICFVSPVSLRLGCILWRFLVMSSLQLCLSVATIWHKEKRCPPFSTRKDAIIDLALRGCCVLLWMWRLMGLMIPRDSTTTFPMSPLILDSLSLHLLS